MTHFPGSVSGKCELDSSSEVSLNEVGNRLSGEIKGVCGGTSWKEQKFRDKSSGFDFTMDELWESYMRKSEWVSVSSPKKWYGTKLLHEDPFHGLKGE